MSATTNATQYSDKPSRLPRWVNTLLVIALGWALAVLSLKLLPAPAMAFQSAAVVPNQTATQNVDPMQLASITAGLHLFGDASKNTKEVVAEKKEEPVKKTSLQLALSGVFAYSPAEKAIAIISAGSDDQSAYGIGDKVTGEVTLEEVHKEYVILNNRGKRERLDLPEDSQPIAMRPVQQAQATTSTQGQASNGAAGSANDAPIELPTTPGALRDTLARNPSMLGRIVAAEPYQENGKLLGYRITPKQNPEILEAQGIVAGDVITKVNNIQLNSQKQGIRALRNAVKAQALEVTVLRDGAEIPLSISLEQ